MAGVNDPHSAEEDDSTDTEHHTSERDRGPGTAARARARAAWLEAGSWCGGQRQADLLGKQRKLAAILK